MGNDRLLTTSYGTNRSAFSLSDWGLFSGVSLIWGASFLLMDIGLDSFHPGLVTFLRVGFGAVTLSLLARTRKTKTGKENLARVRLLGVLWIAIPMTLFPIAQQWINSAIAGMINGATPIFTAAVAGILLGALPGRLQLAGLAVGLVGVFAMALPSVGEGTSQAIGVVLALLATVCYALALNMVTPLSQRHRFLGVMSRILWVATIAVAPLGIYGLTQSSFSSASLAAMVAVGSLGTGLAFWMMGALVGSVGSTRGTFITYVIPVVALILGVAFRGDIVSPLAIVGVLLVISGAILASRKEV